MICDVCKADLISQPHAAGCPFEGIGNDEYMAHKALSTGWKCPECNRIYSPLTAECKFCNSEIKK
ncbi:MAG: hypothetical protein GTN53_22905 [Candidatus Aminicenantes bacterium]|nr:hypothetical protein [Candidatus Aminicenantes bacterium]NIT25355.1 hypothetical protein [Candidatus Aminicenantes bacterium]